MRHVYADNPAGRANLLGREEAIDPRAAAEIDDHLARAHRRERLRIAATEPEIRTLRQGGQLRFGITHGARDLRRRGSGPATTRAAGSDAAVPVAHQLLDPGRAHREPVTAFAVAAYITGAS